MFWAMVSCTLGSGYHVGLKKCQCFAVFLKDGIRYFKYTSKSCRSIVWAFLLLQWTLVFTNRLEAWSCEAGIGLYEPWLTVTNQGPERPHKQNVLGIRVKLKGPRQGGYQNPWFVRSVLVIFCGPTNSMAHVGLSKPKIHLSRLHPQAVDCDTTVFTCASRA